MSALWRGDPISAPAEIGMRRIVVCLLLALGLLAALGGCSSPPRERTDPNRGRAGHYNPAAPRRDARPQLILALSDQSATQRALDFARS